MVHFDAGNPLTINYALNDPIKTEPCNAFSYTANQVTFNSPPAWHCSVSHTNGPTLVATAALDKIYVGSVTADNAGIATGPVTDLSKKGTAMYTLTGHFTNSIG